MLILFYFLSLNCYFLLSGPSPFKSNLKSIWKPIFAIFLAAHIEPTTGPTVKAQVCQICPPLGSLAYWPTKLARGTWQAISSPSNDSSSCSHTCLPSYVPSICFHLLHKTTSQQTSTLSRQLLLVSSRDQAAHEESKASLPHAEAINKHPSLLPNSLDLLPFPMHEPYQPSFARQALHSQLASSNAPSTQPTTPDGLLTLMPRKNFTNLAWLLHVRR